MHAGAAEGIVVRPARADDEEPLLAIDRATWSPQTSPSPAPPEGPFFNHGTTRLDIVWVAEVDGGRVAGYAKMDHPTPLPASEHVWIVNGLAVDPSLEGRGIGRALMEALVEEVRARGGEKLSLRVFSTNPRAIRLYERLGFEVEGVLKREFRIGDGEYVDDLLMAIALRPRSTQSS